MTAPKIFLKVVSEPATGLVLHAPPVFVASDHSVDYTCGRCASILLHAEKNQVYGLLRRTVGSYNSNDTETRRA
jgi:hypothetical protein